MVQAKPTTKPKIIRKTHKIDVTDQPLGRIATKIVTLLRGKNKPEFKPWHDLGDFVNIENISKIKFTGKKLEQKKYYRHSGYPGGLKETKIKEVFEKNPQKVLYNAVYKMLPKNKLRKQMIKRLRFIS